MANIYPHVFGGAADPSARRLPVVHPRTKVLTYPSAPSALDAAPSGSRTDIPEPPPPPAPDSPFASVRVFTCGLGGRRSRATGGASGTAASERRRGIGGPGDRRTK